MKISNEFTVHAPIDRAWAVLTDLGGLAPCLPGAHLTGVDGDVYSGRVKVKVGPVISDFAGTAKFVEKDDVGHRAVIDAKGRDARSAGNAAALITAQLRPDGGATVVTVDTDLKISGKLAQFGSGMIKEVSEKLLGQFVTALEAKIAAAGPDAVAAATSHVQLEARPLQSGQEAPDPRTRKTTESEVAADLQGAPLDARGDAVPESVATAPAATTAPAGPEPLDLLELAVGSIRRRLVPVAIGAAVLAAAVVVWRLVR